MTKQKFILAACITLFIYTAVVIPGAAVRQDNVPPSKNPPGSLTPAQAPQFVVLGFDDNKYQDGVEWTAQYLRNRVNPKGTGNPATYDSTPARASFYVLALPSYNNRYLQQALKSLYHDGHELGNHSLNHFDGVDSNFTVDAWKKELSRCGFLLTDTLGIPAADIWGFRSPYLSYNNNVFTAIQQSGLVYDCSIEEGNDSTQNGTDYYWPYTLDNGSPGANVSAATGIHQPVDSSHDGLWEVPVYLVVAPHDSLCAKYGIPAGLRKRLFNNLVALTGDTTWDTLSGKITGLDYNFWFDFNMTKNEYIAILKYSLDQRLAGNRAPFIFGAHSDYYSLQYISEPKNCNTNYMQRREAMEAFLDYALSKPEVRVVSARDVIRWMRHPVALNQPFTGPCTLTVACIDSGSVSVNPQKESYATNEMVALTATPVSGWKFERWSGPDFTGTGAALNLRMYKNIAAKAVFIKEEPVLDTTHPTANLVSEATWGSYTDDSSKIISQSLIDDTVRVKFWQRPKTGSSWPWIELVAKFTAALGSVIGVEIEYQCDKPLLILFQQPEFETDNSYAHYQYACPKNVGTWKNIRVPVTRFYQPDWTPLASKKSLKLNTVRNIAFIPSVGEAGDTTEVIIRKFVLYNTTTPIIIDYKARAPSAISLYSIYPGQFNLSVPQAGKYSIAFYSLKGSRIMLIADVVCKKGNNRVLLDRRTLAAGVYVARITDKTMKNASGKILIRR